MNSIFDLYEKYNLSAYIKDNLRMSNINNMSEIISHMDIEYPQGRDYKTYRGFRYHLNFPDAWILDEKIGSGRECANCVGESFPLTGLPDMTGFAMWRGIILGYCTNCAEYDYNYERGPGFYEHGVEMQDNENSVNVTAFDMYLGEIEFEALGDLEMNPENTLENQEKTKKEMNDIINNNEYYAEMHYENNYREDDYDEQNQNEDREVFSRGYERAINHRSRSNSPK